MELVFILIAAYLIGSIPFGLLLTRMAGLGDIRAIGSGNIGATNVLRTGRKGLAALTLFLDGAKGCIAIEAARWYLTNPESIFTDCVDYYCETARPETLALVGLAALIGHCFPIWLKFKGGKGVATALGVALGLNWILGVAACATWLLMALAFRRSSLAALVAIGALPGYAYYINKGDPLLGFNALIIPLAVVAAIVWARHHENIKRLLNGTEPKIGAKK